jgi:hypothetical protein
MCQLLVFYQFEKQFCSTFKSHECSSACVLLHNQRRNAGPRFCLIRIRNPVIAIFCPCQHVDVARVIK